LQKGVNNIDLDLSYFEKKYSIDTKEFYVKFEKGEYSDTNDDFIQWSGEYEIFLENKRKLKELL